MGQWEGNDSAPPDSFLDGAVPHGLARPGSQTAARYGRLKRRSPAAVLLLAAVLLGGYAYSTAAPPPTYLTAPVRRGDIATIVKATGTVNAVLTVDVSSQLSGRVADVFVNFNDPVKAGQPIARVDPESYVAQVNQAKADLKIAEASVELQQASLERARATLDNARVSRRLAEAQLAGTRARLQDLDQQLQRKLVLARKGAGTQADVTSTRAQRDSEAANERGGLAQIDMQDESIAIAAADLRMVEAGLKNAQAVVEQKQAALQQALVDLERTEIRAPIDGVVIKRAVNPGQTVAVSLEAKTLFTIANDLRDMQVEGKIDEADIGRLQVGQPVRFTVDAYPDKVFAGEVRQIRKSPEVAQTVVTYTAVISAPNPDQLLFPGMTANLQITTDETKDTLTVPDQALRFRPKGQTGAHDAGPDEASKTVWVLGDDGRPLPVRIRIGKDDGRMTQLVSGSLAEGQQLIVGTAAAPPAGLFGLRWGR